MIFDLLIPPQGPRGWGQKKFYVASPIHVSNSHTKFGWILSNGLGGDSIMDRQQDGIWFWPQYPQIPTPRAWPRRQNKKPVWYVLYLSFVRRGGDNNIPSAFFKKKRGDNNRFIGGRDFYPGFDIKKIPTVGSIYSQYPSYSPAPGGRGCIWLVYKY